MKIGYHGIVLLLVVILFGGCTSTQTTNPRGEVDFSATSSGTNLENSGDNRIEQTPDFIGLITETPDGMKTPLIVRVLKEGELETIEIVNTTSSSIDISGYILYSEKLDDRLIIPVGTVLDSQDSFIIYNGKSTKNDLGFLWHEDFSINNVEDQLLLLNQAGRIIYYYTYYP